MAVRLDRAVTLLLRNTIPIEYEDPDILDGEGGTPIDEDVIFGPYTTNSEVWARQLTAETYDEIYDTGVLIAEITSSAASRTQLSIRSKIYRVRYLEALINPNVVLGNFYRSRLFGFRNWSNSYVQLGNIRYPITKVEELSERNRYLDVTVERVERLRRFAI